MSCCAITRATLADVDELIYVMQVALDTSCEAQFEMSAHDWLALDNQLVYFARVDGVAIGCMMVDHAPTALMHTLGIAPDHRGQRHSYTLIQAVIDELHNGPHPPSAYWTAVDPALHNGVDRFAHHGFVDSQRRHAGLILMVRRPH
jgi:N-acetylglutamate synthase-like GNAT family acetyltransferase